MSQIYWPLYEVFIRNKKGLSHRHVGSLARRRRPDGAGKCPRRLHPPQRRLLHLGGESERNRRLPAGRTPGIFDPADSKVYRHPTFYTLPDGIEHM